MGKIKKILISVLFLGIVLFLETGVVRADMPENGWFVEAEKTYYYVDGEKVVNSIREIDGDYYGFDPSGIMFCDLDFESRDGVMYYDSELGTPTRQTIISYRAKKDGKLYHNEWSGIIGGDRYYLDDCTLAVNCVVQIGDEYYGFNEYGFMFENESFSIKQGEETNYYHAPCGGKLLRDCWWAQQQVYYTADGSAAKGLFEVEGITYLFSNTGVIRKNAVGKIDGVWYISDANGVAEVPSPEDGWKNLNGYMYYLEHGDLLCNCVKQIEDDFYGFDENGKLYSDGYFTIRDEEDRVHHYYAKEDGKLYKDTWIDWNGAHYYYCDSNGEVVQGIAEVGGESYLFSDKGKLQIETLQKIGDVWYAGDGEGHALLLTEGWNAAGDAWFYLENGSPVKSKALWIRNGYYGFDREGKMYDDTEFWLPTGQGRYRDVHYRAKPGGKLYSQQWLLVDGRWYYYKKGGAAPTGVMYRICGKRYGFNTHGYLIISGSGVGDGTVLYETFITDENGIACALNNRGWIRIEDHWFYADSTEGYGYDMLHSGWLRWSGEWYYLDPESRVMQTGWRKIEGTWYYFHEDGSMASNEWVDGYWLSKNGAWIYQPKGRWRKNSKGWWFEDEKGWYPKGETVKINGTEYTFDADGYLAE